LSFEHEHNPVDDFNTNVEIFRASWVQFTKKYMGIKIHYSDLTKFFESLGVDLGGFNEAKTKKDKNQAAREIFIMSLE